MALFIKYLQGCKPLLIVNISVVSSHVLLHVHFRVDFAFGGAATGQEGLHLRAVLFEVVVVNVLDAVDVKDRRLMEVMRERH